MVRGTSFWPFYTMFMSLLFLDGKKIQTRFCLIFSAFYFNHNDGTYLNDLESLVKTMIKAATSNDASYTLESIYNRAP